MNRILVTISFWLLLILMVQAQKATTTNLEFITSVRQKGPVSYRNPIGAISPDNKLLATSNFENIVIQHIEGGATYELQRQGAFVRYMTWMPDSKKLVTYELGGKGKTWYVYDLETKKGKPLWGNRDTFSALVLGKDTRPQEVPRANFRSFTWSADGSKVAGVALNAGKQQLWVFNADGSNAEIWAEANLIENPQWDPTNGKVAAIVKVDGKRHIDLDLKNNVSGDNIAIEAYSSLAFSPDGSNLYFSAPNDRGVLDLWKYEVASKSSTRLTSFTRDSYGPVTSSDGSVLFKLQDYRVFIASVSGQGGDIEHITTFQSEIPYWHPNGKEISFTYGTWRRIVDDTAYPDIDQHLGVVDTSLPLPAAKPTYTVRSSYSEDQGMCWSPNLKWIAFHTHADGTDDVWLMPVGKVKEGRPISNEGGKVDNNETGWPRWSPDGNWIAYNTAPPGSRDSKLHIVGVNQETGELTNAPKKLLPPGLEAGDITDCYWTSDSKRLVIEYVVDPDHKAIHIIPIDGGKGRKVHEFESDQRYSGISFSHDEKWVAYIAPDQSGIYQLFKVSIDGKEVKQLTFDKTDKTHPAWSPTEDKVAFTVFSYQVIFWRL